MIFLEDDVSVLIQKKIQVLLYFKHLKDLRQCVFFFGKNWIKRLLGHFALRSNQLNYKKIIIIVFVMATLYNAELKGNWKEIKPINLMMRPLKWFGKWWQNSKLARKIMEVREEISKVRFLEIPK